jgi:hypothetical protein
MPLRHGVFLLTAAHTCSTAMRNNGWCKPATAAALTVTCSCSTMVSTIGRLRNSARWPPGLALYPKSVTASVTSHSLHACLQADRRYHPRDAAQRG